MSGIDMNLWKGLFEWSLQHQDGAGTAQPMSESERQWLEEAMKSSMVDLGRRMGEIKESLDARASGERSGAEPAAELAEAERLLDELQDIVETIDAARDLATIGGLDTLSDLLTSREPSLRARAAEVGGTCVQNTPEVQTRFLEHPTFADRVLRLAREDADATCRVKALLALSCLVRGHAAATAWFKGQGGLGLLVDAAQLLRALVLGLSASELQSLVDDRVMDVAGRLLGDAGDDAGREAVAELLRALVARPAGAEAARASDELRQGPPASSGGQPLLLTPQ
ncbi:hypothetical protein QBZ16_004710 [Prototheca wickerhamii]|uniref:Nucleotide exchange factor Fes1 domain-containing protein n=1 Tax=Prototheca wickerhamii TaxID=3111 RepID=A0AAD9IEV7_PROWI|nr:hypothetical protein QBZ16_004710 [Prototheca wickerhamii]